MCSEIRVDDRLVFHNLCWRTLCNDSALGHNNHPVADVANHVHVVLNKQHCGSIRLEVFDVVEQRLGERRVHSGHRLIEHYEFRFGHQRAGHLEQLALPTR